LVALNRPLNERQLRLVMHIGSGACGPNQHYSTIHSGCISDFSLSGVYWPFNSG